MTTVIHTENAPKAIGPYVQAVDLGNLVLTSGKFRLIQKQAKSLRILKPKLANPLKM